MLKLVYEPSEFFVKMVIQEAGKVDKSSLYSLLQRELQTAFEDGLNYRKRYKEDEEE